METFPEDPFETVKTGIVGGDERQVCRGLEVDGRGSGDGDHGIAVCL